MLSGQEYSLLRAGLASAEMFSAAPAMGPVQISGFTLDWETPLKSTRSRSTGQVGRKKRFGFRPSTRFLRWSRAKGLSRRDAEPATRLANPHDRLHVVCSLIVVVWATVFRSNGRAGPCWKLR